jgi:hypothetical protein
MEAFIIFLFFVAIFILAQKGRMARATQTTQALMQGQQTIIKTYKGSQSTAQKLFQADSVKMAGVGYFPKSQSWAAGQWGAGAFLVALLLCLVLIGLLVFVYMLVVKPEGSLTVVYEYRQPQSEEKVCPDCAESVKAAAAVCRFCGHKFRESFETVSDTVQPPERPPLIASGQPNRLTAEHLRRSGGN